jgi:NADH:ubiquinone oxidoreductase subunit 5 (subunit L)/multisubunit Na+/H+ antiporter MnhA subunit
MCGIAVLPGGAYLLLRSLPLLQAAPSTGGLLVGVGSLSAVLWGAVALTQPDIRRAAVCFTAATFGLVLVAVGTLRQDAGPPVRFLVCNVMLLSTAVFLIRATNSAGPRKGDALDDAARGQPQTAAGRGRWSVAAVALVLASGMWGQESVLRSLWEAARPVAVEETDGGPAAVAGTSPATLAVQPIPAVVPLLAGVAHWLMCCGLFRCLILDRCGGNANSEEQHDLIGLREGPGVSHYAPSARASRWLVPVATVSAVVGGPWLLLLMPTLFGELPGGRLDSADARLAYFCLPGTTGLLMLLALLPAWVLYAQPSPWTARLERSLGALSRLSRHRFYVDDVLFIVWSLPIRAAAWACRFADAHVFQAGLLGLPVGLAGRLGRRLESLYNGQPHFYVLTLLITLATLVVVLTRG